MWPSGAFHHLLIHHLLSPVPLLQRCAQINLLLQCQNVLPPGQIYLDKKSYIFRKKIYSGVRILIRWRAYNNMFTVFNTLKCQTSVVCQQSLWDPDLEKVFLMKALVTFGLLRQRLLWCSQFLGQPSSHMWAAQVKKRSKRGLVVGYVKHCQSQKKV